jgi:hypothetical protein
MMAAKRDARSAVRKQVGKKPADAILRKLDKMAKEGKPASAVEKVLEKELAEQIEATIIPIIRPIIKSPVGKIIRTPPQKIIKSSAGIIIRAPGQSAKSKS